MAIANLANGDFAIPALVEDDGCEPSGRVSPRTAHFARFDCVLIPSLGVTSLTITDDPSAADSLRAWAELHGFATEVRAYGVEGIRHLVAVGDGFELAVQLRVGCANCGHLEVLP